MQHMPEFFYHYLTDLTQLIHIFTFASLICVIKCTVNINISVILAQPISTHFILPFWCILVYPNTVLQVTHPQNDTNKNVRLTCKQYYSGAVAEVATQKTPFGYDMTFVIMMAIKSHH